MITINNIHPGRFGNHVLYYNNLYQIAKEFGIEYNSIKNPYLELIGVKCDLDKADIKGFIKYVGVVEENKDYYLDHKLGESFYDGKFKTRDLFNIKDVYPNNKNITGLHFRGGDFHQWNQKSILSSEYYIKCIQDSKDETEVFILHTDDVKLKSYNEVIKYLEINNINYSISKATIDSEIHWFEDFLSLASCDIIISSPSTFSICAGIMGRNNTNYQSKDWVEHRVSENDKFWIDLMSNQDNTNYKIKKII